MNRLAGASSPYLRQHATNPVDWYPWSDEALERARTEDKPLFVSIGYAACHWCHVMAHESFQDPETAAALSRSFVSVKVDREERPDIDAVYMAAVQAMTGSGGWPMSVFCTPDGRPFFAGTYFPPTDRHGLPGFGRVVESVARAWRDRRADVESQADALTGAVAGEALVVDRVAASSPPASRPRWEELLGKLAGELAGRFDPRWGGFGPAPKFPRPTFVELCLRHYRRTGDGNSLTMATTTLDAMAAGGIYDHLEGGFARYSTDERWLVPHFEKMLTDQALLARAYLHAWQVLGVPRYLQVVTETLDYVCTTLGLSPGGLSASVDADAAGVEGGHATWTPSEVRQALADSGMQDAATAVCEWYGITHGGNWEGRSVLHRPVGAPLERPPEIEAARRALLAARRRRPQPARDEKVLTEWNAMFIATLAEAAAVCRSEPWRERALSFAEHLFHRNRRADMRWLRVPVGADGVTVPAFSADYAWVTECCTRLAELTGRARWIEQAEATATTLLAHFWDDERGGVFTSADDAERLIVRGKEVVDGAVPSANSVAAAALLRLAALTGSERWRRAGERIVELATPLLVTQGLAVADLGAAASILDNGSEVVVAGDRPDLLAAVQRHWLPDSILAWGDTTASPIWEGRAPGAAYVCRDFVCQRPAADVETLEAQLVPLATGRPR